VNVTTDDTPGTTDTITRRSEAAENRLAHLRRLAGCLALAFVLALMIGNQEGTQLDFGFAFRKAVLGPRIIVFVIIGVLVYLAVTFWPYLKPYLRRPGIRPLAAGAISVVAGYALLKWTDSDQIDTGKLANLAKAGRDTGGLDALTRLFLGSAVPDLYWLLLVVSVVLGAVSLVRRNGVLCYVTVAVAVLAGVWGLYAQASVRSFLGTPDHSTGGLVSLLGYLTIAASALTVATSVRDESDTRGFVDRVFAWRPGMPLVVAGAVLGLVSIFAATWFSPTNKNDKVSNLANRFSGTGISGLSSAYVSWLLYLLLVVTLGVAAFASYRRRRQLGWVALALGLVSLLVTLVVMQDLGSTAAGVGFDGATSAWQDFGVGAWLMAAVFTLLAGAGWMVATVDERALHAEESSDTLAGGTDNIGRVLLVVVIAGALFYPPTATQFWQTVLVTEIGIFVLLAIGLNVVVGWAGLLDLGFIAFYAIGSYTTAYLTDRLPIHPPGWLHLTPLQAIPFAILICLIAGVLLGAPTLRLRGDYLAIVTLGFGEIVRVVANNGESVTNGARGAFNIPPPSIHLGPLHFTWGDSALGFWYLLLVLVVIVVVLFHRLENSRLGRAWAAIREDEVAAQATGINTTRVKLLAFAIGASTSGVAGVFFASQVGSFTPENFILNNSILVVAYVVFGGMGSLPGAMAGAAVLTWLPEFLKDQVPAEDRQMWIGAAILIMMIFRPSGLVPARRRKAELSGLDRPASAESSAVPAGEGM
jgi:ABC-type branched-subunit amino acid transport system permease subunit